MKKIICLLLILSLTLSLGACQTAKAPQGDAPIKTENTKNDASSVLEGFIEAFTQLDLKSASEFIQDGPTASLPFNNINDLSSMLKSEIASSDDIPIPGIENYIVDDFFIPLINKYFESFSYNIISCEQNGDNYDASIEITHIDMESLLSIDFSDMINSLDEDFLNNLIINSGITEDMDSDELMTAIYKPMLAEALRISLETLDDAEQKTSTINLTLTEVDGKILITDATELMTLYDVSSILS